MLVGESKHLSKARRDGEAGHSFAERGDGAGELDPLHLTQRQPGGGGRQQTQHLLRSQTYFSAL